MNIDSGLGTPFRLKISISAGFHFRRRLFFLYSPISGYHHNIQYKRHSAFLSGYPSAKIIHPITTCLSSRAAQQSKPANNAGSKFLVLRLSMAVTPKFRRLCQQTSSIPRSMTLALVRDDLDFKTTRLGTAGAHLGSVNTVLHKVTNIALKAASEVLVESGTTR